VQGDLAAVAVLSCGLFVLVTEPVTIPVLRRIAGIEPPSARSSRAVPAPRGGGAPIVAGLVIAALLTGLTAGLTFAVAVLAFASIGLAVDLAGLSARRLLVLQAAAGLAVGWSVAGLLALPAIAEVGLAVPLALWLAGYVHAFTFMDGINGISAAHALVGGAAFALIGALRPDSLLTTAGAAIAAGGCAFLPWNAGRARVLLGDVGRQGLGAALALAAAWAVLRGIPPEAALGPLALYLADTGWTLQRRVRAGEPWLAADRTHVYQRLCAAGWSHQKVTVAAAALTAVLSLLGAASLTPYPALRAAADLAGVALLAGYLHAPVLARRGAHAAARQRRLAAAVLQREAA
jgi:UDP-GlcNAc:undecaprenyl-phosphate/decaprenyl-phosphate GlcNAc-1-phosphate transferase